MQTIPRSNFAPPSGQTTTRNRHILLTVLHNGLIQQAPQEHYAEPPPPQPRDRKHPTVLQQAGQSMRAQPAYSMHSVLSILVQLTNSGRPKYVSLHQGRTTLHQDSTPSLSMDRQSTYLATSITLPLLRPLTPYGEVDTIIRNTSANHTKITHTMKHRRYAGRTL